MTEITYFNEGINRILNLNKMLRTPRIFDSAVLSTLANNWKELTDLQRLLTLIISKLKFIS
ncbi:CLUMA_CG009845, isoform A [Clunio marinus]|uniref:CLUMA_CG009845, isoform A n=1 Tax=Clunio marinus TaxID=568069 RepID=A0A1J1I823_9DIPT|nr:CLUMA_CG009845, isoform A [Clunio marinus]